MSVSIAYYITGHGYGHTVRSMEIIKELFRRRPDATVHVRTSAAAWLFEELRFFHFHYHATRLDVGALQSTSYNVDRAATLAAYADLIERKQKLLDQEIAFLTQEKITAIVSDITPLAFAAAAALRLPAIAEANFTWDWIYQEWLADFPHYAPVIDDIRADYRRADLLLRLPFHGDMSVFSNIVDLPLVARRSSLTRQQARDRLADYVDVKKKIILLGLRQADISHVPAAALTQLTDWHFITTSPALQAGTITCIPEGRLPFQDMVRGCDVILSKPGYSMVAEVIANQTPLVYVTRNDFCEDPILRQALNRYAVCEEMSMEDFNAGHWQEALQKIAAKPALWPFIANHGAETAAERILEYVK
ncbi:hypothetical protein GX408_19900 [bacterium]|nr:hypothetical protein [bacterium]